MRGRVEERARSKERMGICCGVRIRSLCQLRDHRCMKDILWRKRRSERRRETGSERRRERQGVRERESRRKNDS